MKWAISRLHSLLLRWWIFYVVIAGTSCALQQPYRQSFAPQFGNATGAFRIEGSSSAPATPAITDTDCTDFDDLWTAAQEFEKPPSEWGSEDDGCNPYPDEHPRE